MSPMKIPTLLGILSSITECSSQEISVLRFRFSNATRNEEDKMWEEAERGKWESVAENFGKEMNWNEELSNGNINGLKMIWQCTARGSHEVTLFIKLPLKINFELWKYKIFVPSFHHPNSNFLVLSDGNNTQ